MKPFYVSKTRSLIIRRVTGHVVELKLDFTYSSGCLEVARAIIWEIETNRWTGFGECGFSGEKSCPGMRMDLGGGTIIGLAKSLAPWVTPLIGQNASRLEALLVPMPDRLNWDLLDVREGLSIGLYDLVGNASGLPVHALLGGRRRSNLPGMPVVHVGPPDVMARRSLKWVEAGYHHLKIKLRGDRSSDVMAVKAIRKTVGSRIELVADANDGYLQLSEALGMIEALKPYQITYYEDLLNAPLEDIAELRHRSRARIMVDRQAWWPNVHNVVRLGAADVINHHPSNQGGLATALQIDAIARAAGLETAIGSSGTFGLQDAAFMQLGCVIGLTRPCEDIGLLPYYNGPTRGEYHFDRAPSVIRRPYPIRDGVIQVPDRPGLGVEIDRKRLEHCTIGQFVYD